VPNTETITAVVSPSLPPTIRPATRTLPRPNLTEWDLGPEDECADEIETYILADSTEIDQPVDIAP
jgi:hypothetical protein